MAKQVLTIYGSEDGILGVVGNKKLAYGKAKSYLTGKGSAQEGEKLEMSYREFYDTSREQAMFTKHSVQKRIHTE